MPLLFRALFALALLVTVTASAIAEEVRGKIAKIDSETNSIVLTDGAKYIIPDEFYVDDIRPGMQVTLEYDIIDGEKVINDLEIEN